MSYTRRRRGQRRRQRFWTILELLCLCLLIFALIIILLSKEGLFQSTTNIVVCTTLTIAALMFRLYCFDYKTLDYIDFLHPWINYFRENGGFTALQHSVWQGWRFLELVSTDKCLR